MPLVFRCARTGLLYPPDYVENWGRKYGIGLGKEPISEALTNQYDMPVAHARDTKNTMHPVGVCRSQVDFIEVSEEEFEQRKAILAIDDPDMQQRGQIMRNKQLLKSHKLISLFPEEHAIQRSLSQPAIPAE